MKRLRSPRSIACFFALLWAAGNIAIWLVTPYGPRDGWQPPEDEFAVTLLSDGRTLVTIPRSASGERTIGTPETGPVRLWNIETGKLVASHFDRRDVFHRVMPPECRDWLRIIKRSTTTEHSFELLLLDAWTGQSIATFPCHVPKDNVWWSVTHDGRRTGFVTYKDNEPYLECYDVASGRLICKLNASEAWRFSGDGSRLAAVSGKDIVIFELSAGREIARFTDKPQPNNPLYPKQFSRDGDVLLDSNCNVWDLKTGKRRFQVPGIYYNSSFFTADSNELAVVATAKTTSWLAFYELATGREKIERRVPLANGEHPGMHLWEATPNGRLLVATGTPHIRHPSKLEEWLGQFRWFDWFGHGEAFDTTLLIETASGKEVARVSGWASCCSPDGTLLLRSDRNNVYKLWENPPRKPLRWLLPAFAIWTAALTSLACWLGARAQRGTSTKRIKPPVHAAFRGSS